MEASFLDRVLARRRLVIFVSSLILGSWCLVGASFPRVLDACVVALPFWLLIVMVYVLDKRQTLQPLYMASACTIPFACMHAVASSVGLYPHSLPLAWVFTGLLAGYVAARMAGHRSIGHLAAASVLVVAHDLTLIGIMQARLSHPDAAPWVFLSILLTPGLPHRLVRVMGVTGIGALLAIHRHSPAGSDPGRRARALQLTMFTVMLVPEIACAGLAQLQQVINPQSEASSARFPGRGR